MSRNRIIKTEFWKDPKIGKLSLRARLLFIGMWNFADDSGVVRGDPIYLRSEIFTYDDIPGKEINNCLVEMLNLGLICYLKKEDEKLILIRNFLSHQVISRPSSFRHLKVKNDDYSGLTDQSMNDHCLITAKEKEKEKVKEKEKEKDQPALKPERVIEYLNKISGKKFRNTEKHFTFIKARIKEGYSKKDFLQVIQVKTDEWRGTEMWKFVRPETLFGNKMDSYLNQGPPVLSKREADLRVGGRSESNIKVTEAEKYREWKLLVKNFEDWMKREDKTVDDIINKSERNRYLNVKRKILKYEFKKDISGKVKNKGIK